MAAVSNRKSKDPFLKCLILNNYYGAARSLPHIKFDGSQVPVSVPVPVAVPVQVADSVRVTVLAMLRPACNYISMIYAITAHTHRYAAISAAAEQVELNYRLNNMASGRLWPTTGHYWRHSMDWPSSIAAAGAGAAAVHPCCCLSLAGRCKLLSHANCRRIPKVTGVLSGQTKLQKILSAEMAPSQQKVVNTH